MPPPHTHYTALSRTKKAAVLLSKQEQVPYQGGAVRTLVFKPHSELFHLNKPVVPGVEIKLRFMFNSPDFFLNGVALHGRLTPQDLEMTFHLCQLTLSAPLYKTLDTVRHSRREVAKYPTVHSEIRVFSHAANQLEFNEGNLYQGRIPDRLVVGLLHTLSYHGDGGLSAVFFPKVWVEPNRAVGARRSVSGQCLGIESQHYPQRSGRVFPFPGGQ